MTPRERFKKALKRGEVDRLPFWVKIFGRSYLDLQPPKYREMGELKLAEYLDLDHYAGGAAPVRCINEKVSVRTIKENGKRITLTETPDGTLRRIDAFDEGSLSWYPVEFPVKMREDLLALRHRYDGDRYEPSPELLKKAEERIEAVGERGIVVTGIGTSPLLQLIQHIIGPENTYYFLADYPSEMEELMELMHQDILRRLRVLVECAPCDYFVSGETT